ERGAGHSGRRRRGGPAARPMAAQALPEPHAGGHREDVPQGRASRRGRARHLGHAGAGRAGGPRAAAPRPGPARAAGVADRPQRRSDDPGRGDVEGRAHHRAEQAAGARLAGRVGAGGPPCGRPRRRADLRLQGGPQARAPAGPGHVGGAAAGAHRPGGAGPVRGAAAPERAQDLLGGGGGCAISAGRDDPLRPREGGRARPGEDARRPPARGGRDPRGQARRNRVHDHRECGRAAVLGRDAAGDGPDAPASRPYGRDRTSDPRRRQVWRLGAGKPWRWLGRRDGWGSVAEAAPACPHPHRGASGDQGHADPDRAAAAAHAADLGFPGLESEGRPPRPVRGPGM
ncbi:MAG: Ribosomal large subunit pseudouridine synthase C, partial [uncultured Rubellimicrobium sp.]